MANKAIVVLVVLVRELVFALRGFVLAFLGIQFGHYVLNRVRRLEYHREKDGRKRDEVEKDEFLLHGVKVKKELLKRMPINSCLSE